MPGTETKLTPEMEVPIMAIATNHQGDFLLAVKNDSLSVDLPPVIRATRKINKK
jgi:hypothetical protein